MLDWGLLFKAFALMLLIEGLVLFAAPEAMRRAYQEAAKLDQKKLRLVGFGAIIAGVILLNLNR